MNGGTKNSILVIILGIILLLISLTLFRVVLGGFGFLLALSLIFFGLIYLIISIIHRNYFFFQNNNKKAGQN